MCSASQTTARIHFTSLLLAYALIISLFAPFAIKRAQASAVLADRGGDENVTAIDNKANRELSLNSSTQAPAKRWDELLGRFRGRVSEHNKATAVGPQPNGVPWAVNEGRIERQFRGEPWIEKLGIASGQDTEAVAQQSRLKPAVGSANPSPFPTPGYGGDEPGPEGSFDTTPPPRTTGAPGPKLPNLNDIRNAETEFRPTSHRFQPYLVCADCDPQGGGGGGSYYPPNDPNFSTEREQPPNETGEPGVDLGSRNFNWSLPLVSLAGRAGLDLNLSIYYNSLVWTKAGSFIKFNADLGSPAPGFRLGLPILQQKFQNAQTGIWAYMMVTSSGGRIELRQVSSNIYESQDGTYTQLDDTVSSTPIVKTSDGTRLKYTQVGVNNEFRCEEIKDRNGNYISATYNATNGHLLTITDTLDRVVSFVYDGNNNLQAIRQTWGGAAHDWATFEYGESWVAPNFGGGLLVNGPNNMNVTVLTRLNLHDGSFYTFEYNTAFGQVKKIRHFAPDAHELAYTSYNMDASAGQTDCPRFTERRDWGEYGVLGVSQEVVTSYSVAGDGSWSKMTAPDGTIYKEFFATTGWLKGLTTSTKNYANATDEVSDTSKKRTEISWTQDDEGLTYQKNPRPTETNIYDPDGNRRRTTIEYTSYSLPNVVREWGGAAGDVLLRRTTTGYRFDTEYVNRRIIGLVDNVHVYDGPTSALVSKVTYGYDWDFSGDLFQDTPAPHAIRHDRTNYGPGFIYGRGNLSQQGRWDASDPGNASKVVETKWRVNSTGSVLVVRDHLWHQTFISYADSFSDSVNRNTFAYPTTFTDADNFSSTRQYNYNFGAVTRTEDPKGAVQTMLYDAAARILRVTNEVNGAYTRWFYPPTLGYVQQLSTIKAGAGEASAANFLDGWGRVRASSSENPGSAGGFSGQYFHRNQMGNVVSQTNPTEINANWQPSGDDVAGWIWSQQTYDWKGRPLVTTNPDGSTRANSYGGCGCAGGEVITVRDERGRLRKMTMDALARLKQVEELKYDLSVYATTTYTYNARDQITNINQAGLTRTLSYDGHGRLQSRTTPEQGTTTYSYNQDDTLNVVTDARNATTTFGYNNRHLVTSLTYGVPGGVAATPNVSFGYDSAGNRTSMTDGLGSVSYVYNTLSQMTSETRTFNGVAGSFTLSYPSYNLGGQLTNITNQWGAQVGYNYDKTGRTIGVSGAGYAGVTSYVNSIAYRAFAATQVAYGNGRTLSLQYDNRMRMTRWDVPGVMGWEYGYNYLGENTGRVVYSKSLNDAKLDRSYEYNSRGRLVVAHSGAEARAHVGLGQWGTMDGPFSLGYEYDVWGNLTHQYGWGGETQGGTAGQNSDIYRTYANNRIIGPTYDAAGNLTNEVGQTFTYDVTGQQATATLGAYFLQQYYDGNRLRVKKNDNGAQTYYLRSTVLGGQVVAEITWNGASWQWNRGYVYLGSQLLAVQQSGAVSWMHQDPVNKSKRVTNSAGTVVSTVELDPWGADTNRSNNAGFQPRKFTSYERDGNGSDEAMFRRYNRKLSRFDQPDPYDGSYNLTDPQSFNRYAYVQNDPVNFVDPTGLDDVPVGPCPPGVCGVDVPISFDDPIRGGGGGSVLGGDDLFRLVDPPTDAPTGGDVGGPTETPQDPSDAKRDLNAWMATHLKDCLDKATADHRRVQNGIDEWARDAIIGIPTVGKIITAGLLARLAGTSALRASGSGFGLTLAVVSSYGLGQTLANDRAFARAQANCRSVYRQR